MTQLFGKTKFILAGLALAIAAAGGVRGYQVYELKQHQLANEKHAEELFASVEFTDLYDELECKSEKMDSSLLLADKLNEELSAVIYPSKLDLNLPGMKPISFTLKYTDDLGRTHRKIMIKKIDVVDKTPPSIKHGSDLIELWQNDDFSASDNLVSVTDNVDEELAYAEELAPGSYTITSNVDTGTPGKYTVTVTAQDKQGNKTEDSYEVAVYEKPVAKQETTTYDANNNAAAAEPVYTEPASLGVVNFDIFPFIDMTEDTSSSQGYVNAGYNVLLFEDYFHHNTGDFMNLFWSCGPGTTVIIGGRTYTCGGIEHGSVTADKTDIISDSGAGIWGDDTSDIITCDGAPGTSQRWIMHLY